MTTTRMFCAALAVGCALAFTAQQATGQGPAPSDAVMVERPLATRDSVEAAIKRLEKTPGTDVMLLARARARLKDGDFKPGDIVEIVVDSEPSLSKTFTVDANRALRLPAPAVGTMSLTGTLRSELEPQVTTYVARFVKNPVVRARPLLRVSIQGEVVHPGYYGLSPEAVLADALMAAGGTTASADMGKSKVERNGQPIWEGKPLEAALADGRTIDQADLRPGDQFIIAKREPGNISDHLRLFSVVISIAGGLYGLSRAIH